MTYTKKEKAADARYKREYGKSLQWYNEQLAKQNFGCAICGRKPPPGKRLFVDHNHDADRIIITLKKYRPNSKVPYVWISSVLEFTLYYFKTRKAAKAAMRRKLRSLSVRGLLCFICNHKVMGILEKFKVCPQDVIGYLQKYDKANCLLKGI